jgi:hypothetical protein
VDKMCEINMANSLLLLGKYITEDYMKELIQCRLIQGLKKVRIDDLFNKVVISKERVKNIINTLKLLATKNTRWLHAILNIDIIENCLKFLMNCSNFNDDFVSNINVANFILWLYAKNKDSFMDNNEKIIELILQQQKLMMNDNTNNVTRALLILLSLCLKGLCDKNILVFKKNQIHQLKSKKYIKLCRSLLEIFSSYSDKIINQNSLSKDLFELKELSCLCVNIALKDMDVVDIAIISHPVEQFEIKEFIDCTMELQKKSLLKFYLETYGDGFFNISLYLRKKIKNEMDSNKFFNTNTLFCLENISLPKTQFTTKEKSNCEELEFTSIERPWDVPNIYEISNGIVGMNRDTTLEIIYKSKINPEDTRQALFYFVSYLIYLLNLDNGYL